LLPFYGVLRSMPNKSTGIVLMVFSLLSLFPVGFLSSRFIAVLLSKYIYGPLVFELILDAAAAGVLCLVCNVVDILYGLLVVCVLSFLSCLFS
jgi:hypothetical protein